MYVYRNEVGVIVTISFMPIPGMEGEYLDDNDPQLLEFRSRA